jgi:hypothetical protein
MEDSQGIGAVKYKRPGLRIEVAQPSAGPVIALIGAVFAARKNPNSARSLQFRLETST